MIWLIFAGIAQPLAFELYRWAPYLTTDVELARLLVREVTLAGPVIVLGGLAMIPVRYESSAYNVVRFHAWLAAFILMMIVVVAIGVEQNAAYRVAYLLEQLLVVAAWWCAVVGERPRYKLGHYARLAGLLWACAGVVLCVLVQFVFAWDSMLGTVPEYDPYLETPSQAGTLGLHWFTWALVGASLASVPALWGLAEACKRGVPWARRIGARLMPIGWRPL